MTVWGSEDDPIGSIERERWRRIHVLLWAYAYEYENDSLVSDGEFDNTCKEIKLGISTGNELMDKWFKKNFAPYTGQWVHSLPKGEMSQLKRKYDQLKDGKY